MKTLAAGQFKARCLALLDEVKNTHDVLVITKYGKPVACVTPCTGDTSKSENPLKDSILFEEDIVSPLDVGWDAQK